MLFKLFVAKLSLEIHIQQPIPQDLFFSRNQLVHAPVCSDRLAAQEFRLVAGQPDGGAAHQLWRVEVELAERVHEHVCFQKARVHRYGRDIGIRGRQVSHQLLCRKLADGVASDLGEDRPGAAGGQVQDESWRVGGWEKLQKSLDQQECTLCIDFLG